jgi:hypothetical protein
VSKDVISPRMVFAAGLAALMVPPYLTAAEAGPIPAKGSSSTEEKASGPPTFSISDVADLRKESVTDEKGAYSIAGLYTFGGSRRSMMNVSAGGYARISNHPVTVEEGKVIEGRNFELERTAAVSGRVVDSSGVGLAGARDVNVVLPKPGGIRKAAGHRPGK